MATVELTTSRVIVRGDVSDTPARMAALARAAVRPMRETLHLIAYSPGSEFTPRMRVYARVSNMEQLARMRAGRQRVRARTRYGRPPH